MPHVTYKGFSQALQTQGDMLVKLRHDLDRLKADPLDAFAAYDFFVTAFHMSGWPPKASIDPTLLALLKHLAVGAKHFKPTNPRLQSVANVKTVLGFDPAGFGTGFAVGRLMVDLDGDAARKFGKEVPVLALAEQALRAWEAAVAGRPSLCRRCGGLLPDRGPTGHHRRSDAVWCANCRKVKNAERQDARRRRQRADGEAAGPG